MYQRLKQENKRTNEERHRRRRWGGMKRSNSRNTQAISFPMDSKRHSTVLPGHWSYWSDSSNVNPRGRPWPLQTRGGGIVVVKVCEERCENERSDFYHSGSYSLAGSATWWEPQELFLYFNMTVFVEHLCELKAKLIITPCPSEIHQLAGRREQITRRKRCAIANL